MSLILRLTGIDRRFGSFQALSNASLDVEAGRIVALVGENGAGKTTLMRIASGDLRADGGSILLDDPSRRIELVHQHFLLVPHFSIAENLALADRSAPSLLGPAVIRRIAERAVANAPFDLGDLDRLVLQLSAGEKSRVELVKALARKPDVLILDEPTSVLGPTEVLRLGEALRALASRGVGIVIITHKLSEVFAIADDVVVLRKGRVVLRATVASTSPEAVAASMIGDATEQPRQTAPQNTGSAILLSLRDVGTATAVEGSPLRGIGLDVRSGEIVGIAGVAGNGQRELARLLRGLEPLQSGEIFFREKKVGIAWLRTTRQIGHIPPDRTVEGIVAELSIADNMVLARGRSGSAAVALAQKAIEHFQIAAQSPLQTAGSLSGGNQQKVLLARELGKSPEVLVATDPTRGLDIGATAFVHEKLREAAANGAAIILITSDLDEALSLSTRLHVLYRGALSGAVDGPNRHETISRLMAGIP